MLGQLHVSSVFPWWFRPRRFFLGCQHESQRLTESWSWRCPDCSASLETTSNGWCSKERPPDECLRASRFNWRKMENVNLFIFTGRYMTHGYTMLVTQKCVSKKNTSVLWSFTLSGRHVSNSTLRALALEDPPALHWPQISSSGSSLTSYEAFLVPFLKGSGNYWESHHKRHQG